MSLTTRVNSDECSMREMCNGIVALKTNLFFPSSAVIPASWLVAARSSAHVQLSLYPFTSPVRQTILAIGSTDVRAHVDSGTEVGVMFPRCCEQESCRIENARGISPACSTKPASKTERYTTGASARNYGQTRKVYCHV